MTAHKFMVVQHSPNQGRDRSVPGTYGTLRPVSLDGFYAKRDDAVGVAEFMAEMRPDLDTLVVQVVQIISGQQVKR